MPRFPVWPALVAALLVACQSQPSPAATPRPTPSASPTPRLVLRAPADAALTQAEVGLPLVAARDHLSAAEAARDTPNEVLALELYSGWGWVEASTRTWSGGGQQASETVLLTVRASNAGKAYAVWSAGAATAPYAATGCPPSITGLDACRMGTAGDRTLVVGRLDAEVFRLETAGLDGPALAARQTARLPAA